MGSSSKKHKKDRESRKHKHKSRSSRSSKSSDVEIIEDSPSSERDRESKSRSKHHHHHHRHHHSSSSSSRHKSSKRSSRSPVSVKNSSYDSGSKEEKHHHHKKHKEHKHRHQNKSAERVLERTIDVDYHSDSSDVIEVPLNESPPPPPPPVIATPLPPTISRRKSKSPSPIPDGGAGDVLSIQETNKLRAKLGLKPLEVETKQTSSSSSSSKQQKDASDISGGDNKTNDNNGLKTFKDEWGEFCHKPADNLAEKLEAEKIRQKLKERREKRALEDKLKKVKTLGESDDEVDDLKKWVQKSKKKEELLKEAEKRAKMLEEMDEEFGVGNLMESETKKIREKAYRDRDLKGLRVEHDIDEFTEGKEIILTLKDKGVLDDKEDDALINVNLIDNERYKKNVENKKLRPETYGYNVYEEQYDQFGNPIDRGVLEKYDEEIQGMKKKSFTIGENIEQEREHQRKLLEIKTKLAGKKLESLEETALKLASDIYSETEMEKFKKPKKKVKRLRQKLKAEDLLALGGAGDLKSTRDFGSRRNRGGIEGDTVTTKSVRSSTITSKTLLGVELETDDTPDIKEDLSKFKVEIDDEDELQRVLSKAIKLKQKENIIRKPLPIDPNEIKAEIKTEVESDDEMNGITSSDGHIILNATAEFCRTLGDIPTYGMAGNRDEDSNDMMDFEKTIPDDDIDDGLDSVQTELLTGTWNSVNPDLVTRVLSGDEISNDVADIAILDEEPDVGSGVAAALQLAVSKGYLEKEDKKKPSLSRMAHLQAKSYSIEDKGFGEEDKFGRRDRYHTGPIMDFREKETYKPNVKLDYIDDNGRILNAKEAFRYLSHKFHGKGPGKNKIEKRLKKMEQEGLMKQMSSTDTPLGTLSMLQQKQKETNAPYVVLSGSKLSQVGTSISKHK